MSSETRESGYTITALGKREGYVGRIAESDITDALRCAFTVLREEDVPVTPNYIWQLTRAPYNDVVAALNLLVRAGLAKQHD